ncbi:diguanylate cyclase [Bacteroidia bacterium]|nr:diguanylate cyclase [Bacteroidia bacterium]GHT05027.1 diguanylate cyclase [Bacteroidia bacterium]GHT48248.1 diguanylate cyclase [Bacteroidia bacterium]
METLFETKFAGLTLSNPIIIASSGLTDTVDKNKELEKAGAGALVLKSLFEEQISKNTVEPMLRYFQTNEVNNYMQLIQETKEACRIPVIASINCYKDDSWVEFAHQIETAGADALELNLFAFNTGLDEATQPVEEVYIRVIKKIKEVVRIPVIVKMGKYLSPIVQLVNQFDKIGVAGVVLFNRFYQPDIDINQLQMTSGHVFSTHTDINDTLRWTGIISGKLPQVSIAACTGIHDWESIIKCILSGASAVQICSTVYQNGNEIIPQMKRSMEEWMQGLNFHSLDEFRGKLNYAHIQDPSLYERIQFMRYFSNRD